LGWWKDSTQQDLADYINNKGIVDHFSLLEYYQTKVLEYVCHEEMYDVNFDLDEVEEALKTVSDHFAKFCHHLEELQEQVTMLQDAIDTVSTMRQAQRDLELSSEKILDGVGKMLEKPLVVLLSGETGVGKSTLACWLTDTCRTDVFKVSDTDVLTTKCHDNGNEGDTFFSGKMIGEKYQLSTEDKESGMFEVRVKVIDAPGMGNDPDFVKDEHGQPLDDAKILLQTKDYIKTTCKEISALVWMEHAYKFDNDIEVDIETRRLMRDYARLFQLDTFRNVIVVFTKDDEIDSEDAEENLQKMSNKFRMEFRKIGREVFPNKKHWGFLDQLVDSFKFMHFDLPEISSLMEVKPEGTEDWKPSDYIETNDLETSTNIRQLQNFIRAVYNAKKKAPMKTGSIFQKC